MSDASTTYDGMIGVEGIKMPYMLDSGIRCATGTRSVDVVLPQQFMFLAGKETVRTRGHTGHESQAFRAHDPVMILLDSRRYNLGHAIILPTKSLKEILLCPSWMKPKEWDEESRVRLESQRLAFEIPDAIWCDDVAKLRFCTIPPVRSGIPSDLTIPYQAKHSCNIKKAERLKEHVAEQLAANMIAPVPDKLRQRVRTLNTVLPAKKNGATRLTLVTTLWAGKIQLFPILICPHRFLRQFDNKHKWVAIGDAPCFYGQIRVRETEAIHQAFEDEKGRPFYQRCLTMGHPNGSAIAHATMTRGLENAEWARAYVDNVATKGDTIQQLRQRVRSMLISLGQHGIALDPRQFLAQTTRTNLMGFIMQDCRISHGGKPSERCKQVRTLADAKSALAHLNYYATLVPRFQDKAAPIYTEVASDNRKTTLLTENSRKLLKDIAVEVEQARIDLPGPDDKIELTTDWSMNAIGITISFVDNKAIKRPHLFGSIKCSPSMAKLPAPVGELMALGIYLRKKYIQWILACREVTYLTDCGALSKALGVRTLSVTFV